MPPPADLYIKFFASVSAESVAALMGTLDQAVRDGTKRVTLLISTPGGDVFHGLSAYNYLRGLPLEVHTHNFGSVDSIGVVLFCAGTQRASVPRARFLLHGVATQFQAGMRLEEKQLEERLKALRIDTENIARIISDTTGKPLAEVVQAMLDRTTLTPQQAKAWGIVTAIASDLLPDGARLVSIQQSTPTSVAEPSSPA